MDFDLSSSGRNRPFCTVVRKQVIRDSERAEILLWLLCLKTGPHQPAPPREEGA